MHYNSVRVSQENVGDSSGLYTRIVIRKGPNEL